MLLCVVQIFMKQTLAFYKLTRKSMASGLIAKYCTVTRRSTSQLVAHPRIFRLFIKVKFDSYVLWTLGQRVQNWIVKTNSPKWVVTMVYFTTISGHFLASPFSIFHKTEILLIQNDLWNISFVIDIKGVGPKMTRNGRKMNYSYYSFRWISL